MIVPKFIDEGLASSWPGPNPSPVSGTEIGPLAFSTVIDSVPVTEPADLGEKVIETVALCPAASVSGIGGALIVKPEPATAAWETTTFGPAEDAELVSMIELVLLLPTFTLPKSSDEELRVRFAA